MVLLKHGDSEDYQEKKGNVNDFHSDFSVNYIVDLIFVVDFFLKNIINF